MGIDSISLIQKNMTSIVVKAPREITHFHTDSPEQGLHLLIVFYD